jgi:hypothetical protein
MKIAEEGERKKEPWNKTQNKTSRKLHEYKTETIATDGWTWLQHKEVHYCIEVTSNSFCQ